jgi:transglutaminase-like putative cysteine protease
MPRRTHRFAPVHLLFALFAVFSTSLLANQTIQNGGYSYQTGAAPDWVKHHELPENWPSDYQADAPMRIWQMDNQNQLDIGEYVEYSFEARSAKVLEEAANYRIDFAPSWQTLVIHEVAVRRNGQWSTRLQTDSITLARRESGFESLGYNGIVSAMIVIKDAQVGDVIRLRYSTLGAHPLLAGQAGQNYYLHWDQPILHRRIRLKHPVGKALSYRARNRQDAYQFRTGELNQSTDEITVHLQRPKIISWVDQLPRWIQPWPELQIAPVSDWASKRTWAIGLFDAKLDQVQARVQKLGVAKRPAAEQALAALRMVQDEIRYFAVLIGQSTHRAHEPAEVLKNGYGDCKDKTNLLTAMLRALGIEAYPALVNATQTRAIKDSLPDAGQFDHVIVQAKINGTTYWLDPTINLQGGTIDSQGFPDYGYALVLNPDLKEGLTEMQPASARVSKMLVSEAFAVGADLSTQLEVKTQWLGERAERLRGQVAEAGRDKMSEYYKQEYAKQFGAISKAQVSFVDHRASNEYHAAESYQLAEMWKNRSDYQFADLYASGLESTLSMPSMTDRSAPLEFPFPRFIEHRIEINLPKGASFDSELKDLSIDDPAFHYQRKTVIKGQTLSVAHLIETKLTAVNDQLSAHLKNRRAALDALSARVVWQFENTKATADATDIAARKSTSLTPEQRAKRFEKLIEVLREE